MNETFIAAALVDRLGVVYALSPVIMYIGPGVAVPVLTGLATVLGLIMLAWDKVVHVAHKLLRIVRPASSSPPASAEDET
jgi:hypothetical protein